MQSNTRFDVRRGRDRGSVATSWLDARFSFSFGTYQDRARDGFGPLRALNEDVIQPHKGFAMHPHTDMEIFIMPLSGVVEHRDSLGNHGLVRPGEVQKMSAGAGIQHSQMNASGELLDHHLQIWIEPSARGGAPSVQSRRFGIFDTQGRWVRIISPDGSEGSFAVDQRAWLSTVLLAPNGAIRHIPRAGSAVYLHVASGALRCTQSCESLFLSGGDAVAIHSSMGAAIELQAQGHPALALVFEFAGFSSSADSRS